MSLLNVLFGWPFLRQAVYANATGMQLLRGRFPTKTVSRPGAIALGTHIQFACIGLLRARMRGQFF